MPKEVKKYLTTSNKPIVYSGDEVQERDSVEGSEFYNKTFKE